MALAVVLLAAGASRRMRGRDKLLEPVAGEPLLRHLARAALAAGLGPVGVTLAPGADERRRCLAGLVVDLLDVPDAAEGMAASLRAAARWAEGAGVAGLMVCPADMPELTTEDFARLAAGFAPNGPPLRATDTDGTPGHPVLFPARMLPRFATLTGDEGARALLRIEPPHLVALPGTHATTDLDTPEDWARWRDKRR